MNYNYHQQYSQYNENSNINGTNNIIVGVAVIIFNPQNSTILVSERLDSGKIALPGGKLEKYEEVEQCARRELKEETDLNIDLNEIKIFDVLNVIRVDKNFHSICYMTAIKYQNKHIQQLIRNNEPNKHGEWFWANEENLTHMYNNDTLFHGIRQMIKNKYKRSPGLFLQDLHYYFNQQQQQQQQQMFQFQNKPY